MLFLHGLVHLRSALPLEEVARLVSERLCGGVPFVKTREFDELPGMRLSNTIMMLEIRVSAEPPDFGLHIDTDASLYPAQGEFPKLEIVDLSEYIETALQGIEQIRIMPLTSKGDKGPDKVLG